MLICELRSPNFPFLEAIFMAGNIYNAHLWNFLRNTSMTLFTVPLFAEGGAQPVWAWVKAGSKISPSSYNASFVVTADYWLELKFTKYLLSPEWAAWKLTFIPSTFETFPSRRLQAEGLLSAGLVETCPLHWISPSILVTIQTHFLWYPIWLPVMIRNLQLWVLLNKLWIFLMLVSVSLKDWISIFTLLSGHGSGSWTFICCCLYLPSSCFCKLSHYYFIHRTNFNIRQKSNLNKIQFI